MTSFQYNKASPGVPEIGGFPWFFRQRDHRARRGSRVDQFRAGGVLVAGRVPARGICLQRVISGKQGPGRLQRLLEISGNLAVFAPQQSPGLRQ
jgi:hypothetical protein